VKFFCHFGLEAFSNAYLVGPDEGGEAVLIDPGVFDETLLAMIEKNRLDLRHVLLTHSHESHMRGVHTALKIYDAVVYGMVPLPRIERHRTIEDGEVLRLGSFRIRVLWTPAARRRRRLDDLRDGQAAAAEIDPPGDPHPRRRDHDLPGTRAPVQGRGRAGSQPGPA
jgi:hypothetical protein